jgi:hypothetical protein
MRTKKEEENKSRKLTNMRKSETNGKES